MKIMSYHLKILIEYCQSKNKQILLQSDSYSRDEKSNIENNTKGIYLESNILFIKN